MNLTQSLDSTESVIQWALIKQKENEMDYIVPINDQPYISGSITINANGEPLVFNDFMDDQTKGLFEQVEDGYHIAVTANEHTHELTVQVNPECEVIENSLKYNAY